MTDLTVFDPFREMVSIRSMLDQAFDNMLVRRGDYGDGVLTLDMYQTDDEVVIKAALPGIKSDDIHISIANDILTIEGQTKEEKITEKARYHIRERHMGSFTRSVQLPVPVVTDKAEAKFENGVLSLTLPKAAEVKPKTITVKVK